MNEKLYKLSSILETLPLAPKEAFEAIQQSDVMPCLLDNMGLSHLVVPNLMEDSMTDTPNSKPEIHFEESFQGQSDHLLGQSHAIIHPSWKQKHVDNILIFRLRYVESREKLVKMMTEYWESCRGAYQAHTSILPTTELSGLDIEQKMDALLDSYLSALQKQSLQILSDYLVAWDTLEK